MERHAKITVQVLKRLRAAVGYYELGMTRQAVASLDNLERLGDIGHFRLVADILRDQFAASGESTAAASALEIVACMLPAPGQRAVRMTLASCFGDADVRDTTRAIKGSTRSALMEDLPK